MKLRHQLVTLSLGLSLLLILILGGLLALFIRHLLESNLEEKGSDLARVLASLHTVDWKGAGLDGFGRPELQTMTGPSPSPLGGKRLASVQNGPAAGRNPRHGNDYKGLRL